MVRRYEPLTVARLGALLAEADETRRWRLVAEFLEEYRWEPSERRAALLQQEPSTTGDEHWDVFLAALTEHLAAKDGRGAPSWVETRSLRRFWFPSTLALLGLTRWSMPQRRSAVVACSCQRRSSTSHER